MGILLWIHKVMGGVALLWRNEGSVNIIGCCHNYIDFEVTHEQLGSWRYTVYYGFPERERRVDSWNMMRELATMSVLPWCIIGDFNYMVTLEEKKGGVRQPRNLLEGFSEAIVDCGLVDLGFTDEIFTWERARGTHRWVQERLDRGLATVSWIDMFPNAEVKVLEVSTSDHKPLVLNLNKQIFMPRRGRFRFENIWISEQECRSIIQVFSGIIIMDLT